MDKLGIALLNEVKKVITENPDRFMMDRWVEKGKAGSEVRYPDEDIASCTNRKFPKCGTVGCIAGWIVTLGISKEFSSKINVDNIPQVAEDLLGLDDGDGDYLFLEDQWPDELREKFRRAKTAKQAARVAVTRINKFIKEGI